MIRATAWFGAALFCAAPVRATGLPEFTAPLAEIRALVLSASIVREPRPKQAPRLRARPAGKRVADQDAWAKLFDRARRAPSLTQDLRVDMTVYKVFAVLSETSVAGQVCPAMTRLRNALYVAQPVSGNGGGIYPVRLTSECVGPNATLTRFAVDADAEGFIQNVIIYDRARDCLFHLDANTLPAAQLALIEAYLSGLVRLFTE